MEGIHMEDCKTVEEFISQMYKAARKTIDAGPDWEELASDKQEDWRIGLRIISFLDKLSEILINPNRMRLNKEILKETSRAISHVHTERTSERAAQDKARDLAIKLIQLQNYRDLVELYENKEPRTAVY